MASGCSAGLAKKSILGGEKEAAVMRRCRVKLNLGLTDWSTDPCRSDIRIVETMLKSPATGWAGDLSVLTFCAEIEGAVARPC